MKNTMRRIWAARALACGLAFGALAVERPPVAAPALEIPRVGVATLGVEEVTAVDAAPRVIAAESFRELKAWQPSGPSGSCAAMADADARTFVRLGQGRRWGFPHGVRPARPAPVWKVGLLTVKDAAAATLADRIALARPKVLNRYRGAVAAVPNGDGTTTFVATYKPMGCTLFIR